MKIRYYLEYDTRLRPYKGAERESQYQALEILAG